MQDLPAFQAFPHQYSIRSTYVLCNRHAVALPATRQNVHDYGVCGEENQNSILNSSANIFSVLYCKEYEYE